MQIQSQVYPADRAKVSCMTQYALAMNLNPQIQR